MYVFPKNVCVWTKTEIKIDSINSQKRCVLAHTSSFQVMVRSHHVGLPMLDLSQGKNLLNLNVQ